MDPHPRVVSLLASGTEIVCALGAGEWLVGRSHECDNPEWIRSLPACTKPGFDVDGASRDIDAEVRRRLRAGEPLYYVDGERISALHADVLIAQIHCEVCAVTPGDVERSGYTAPAGVVPLSAGSIDGIYDDIRRVARALDLSSEGDALVSTLTRGIDAVKARVQGRARPSIVLIEWTDPVFTAGNWAPSLVDAAGGQSLLGHDNQRSTTTPWEQVLAANPDALVIAPCGFSLERTLKDLPVLEQLPGWFDLAAVKNGRVALADGNRFFNRSGVTIVETAEILAEIIHGGAVDRRWQGTAWAFNHDVRSERQSPQ